MITTASGGAARVLGLAAYPDQDARCVERALEGGINLFFFYSAGQRGFVEALARLLRRRQAEILVATGSGARQPRSLRAARNKACAALGADRIDVFFAEYVNPADDPQAIFGPSGVLDELQRWKAEGRIRFVGASAHDRSLAQRLASDARVDVLMHRFNMAHRKAVREVFPTAMETATPVVAFTATRWGSLLEPRSDWPTRPPTAADCYRYCLAHPAIQLVLSAPKSLDQLEQNLAVFDALPMSDTERLHWERFGDLVRGSGSDAFETEWP
jgi:aryl-alcohol dehydrogenase-like predicted oxidoreductase